MQTFAHENAKNKARLPDWQSNKTLRNDLKENDDHSEGKTVCYHDHR